MNAEIRPITLHVKAEHAAIFRSVGKWMQRRWLGLLTTERVKVAIFLLDIADKIDLAFEPQPVSTVVQLRTHVRKTDRPEPPSAA